MPSGSLLDGLGGLCVPSSAVVGVLCAAGAAAAALGASGNEDSVDPVAAGMATTADSSR